MTRFGEYYKSLAVEQRITLSSSVNPVCGYEFIRKVISEELGCSASIDGIENIPTDDQPVIFVSNHPLGGLDGMIIAELIHNTRPRSLKVIVNELLMFMEPIADLWAPGFATQ